MYLVNVGYQNAIQKKRHHQGESVLIFAEFIHVKHCKSNVQGRKHFDVLGFLL